MSWLWLWLLGLLWLLWLSSSIGELAVHHFLHPFVKVSKQISDKLFQGFHSGGKVNASHRCGWGCSNGLAGSQVATARLDLEARIPSDSSENAI